ncbi:MAG TPA: hypothetical protein VKI44_21295 [Acetobacteraceae bacterium]|nr:hypothetical protein [Acetobacteraceae bacterium]
MDLEDLTLTAPEDAESEGGKLWRLILTGTPIGGTRQVRVGIGDADAKLPRANATASNAVPFELFNPLLLVAGGAGILLLAGGVIAWGWYSGMLRDKTSLDVAKSPFSLARAQMAWWLFIVIGGFLYIWLVMGQSVGVITTGVLALLGISGVSGLAARVIDTPTPGTATSTPQPSQNFFIDILSDGGSVALHRVQMAAWTFILGVITLWTVFWEFSFPKFDNNLLVLAGLVNGVYLGFKFPEK